MSGSSGLRVSVVIPVHNGGETLRRCLESLAALAPAPHETIVVDDGSTDGSARIAAAAGAAVVHTAGQSGPATARNLGARVAAGDVLLFLDADVTVRPDLISRVCGAFAADPELAALFGSYDDAPAETNFLSQYKNLLHHYVHQAAREEAFTFWTGCGAIRREVFIDLGGFDEGYGEPAIEDIELGYRLRGASYRVRLLKDLQVKHLKHWSARDLLRSDFARRALPWSDLILGHGHVANDLNIGWSSRMSVVAVVVLVGSVVSACFWPPFLAITGLSALALLLLNWPLYRFLWRKRGLLFALQSLPWNWLYYLYSGLALVIALVRRMCRSRRRRGAGRRADATTENGKAIGRTSS
jgi:GT2 family glycosyltransferase